MSRVFTFGRGRNLSYEGVITRDYPLWKLTLTGGDLPRSGHVMTSMSYARLIGDMDDWLHWHQFGTTQSYGAPGDDDLDDDDLDDDADDDTGEGYEVTYDCRWPKPAKEAEERYWAASNALERARAALGEPICAIARELKAEDEDIARIVHLPVEKVQRIMQLHHERERLTRDP